MLDLELDKIELLHQSSFFPPSLQVEKTFRKRELGLIQHVANLEKKIHLLYAAEFIHTAHFQRGIRETLLRYPFETQTTYLSLLARVAELEHQVRAIVVGEGLTEQEVVKKYSIGWDVVVAETKQKETYHCLWMAVEDLEKERVSLLKEVAKLERGGSAGRGIEGQSPSVSPGRGSSSPGRRSSPSPGRGGSSPGGRSPGGRSPKRVEDSSPKQNGPGGALLFYNDAGAGTTGAAQTTTTRAVVTTSTSTRHVKSLGRQEGKGEKTLSTLEREKLFRLEHEDWLQSVHTRVDDKMQQLKKAAFLRDPRGHIKAKLDRLKSLKQKRRKRAFKERLRLQQQKRRQMLLNGEDTEENDLDNWDDHDHTATADKRGGKDGLVDGFDHSLNWDEVRAR